MYDIDINDPEAMKEFQRTIDELMNGDVETINDEEEQRYFERFNSRSSSHIPARTIEELFAALVKGYKNYTDSTGDNGRKITIHLFVYGTLREGWGNYTRLLAPHKPDSIRPAVIYGYSLYNRMARSTENKYYNYETNGVPIAVSHADGHVIGEVITFKDRTVSEIVSIMTAVDGLEGHPYCYMRRDVTATILNAAAGEAEKCDAMFYEYLRHDTVSNNDYDYLHSSAIYEDGYFASMDDDDDQIEALEVEKLLNKIKKERTYSELENEDDVDFVMATLEMYSEGKITREEKDLIVYGKYLDGDLDDDYFTGIQSPPPASNNSSYQPADTRPSYLRYSKYQSDDDIVVFVGMDGISTNDISNSIVEISNEKK